MVRNCSTIQTLSKVRAHLGSTSTSHDSRGFVISDWRANVWPDINTEIGDHYISWSPSCCYTAMFIPLALLASVPDFIFGTSLPCTHQIIPRNVLTVCPREHALQGRVSAHAPSRLYSIRPSGCAEKWNNLVLEHSETRHQEIDWDLRKIREIVEVSAKG